MRIALITVAILAALLICFVIYSKTVMDPRVMEELRNNPTSQRARETMLLEFADGRIIPVNYLREGGKIFVGADGRWWRAFRGEGAPVTVEIMGQVIKGHATLELEDQAYIDDIFSRLRPKAPEWLPDWANGKLVIITPQETDGKQGDATPSDASESDTGESSAEESNSRGE